MYCRCRTCLLAVPNLMNSGKHHVCWCTWQEAISAGVARSGCQLKLIDISENAFRGTGIRGMAAILTGPAAFKLEELRMSDQGLSPEGGQVLGGLLKELQENAALENQSLVLRIFKASKNRLENNGATALGRVFKVGMLFQPQVKESVFPTRSFVSGRNENNDRQTEWQTV